MKVAFRLTSDSVIRVKNYTVPGYKNGWINIAAIEPKEQYTKELPALVFFHGGAFCLRASGAHYLLAKEYARRLSCKVIYADYRLAPKYPFPYALYDCFAAYKWTLENAELPDIDINRIIVGGDSAGGNLAIGVIMLAMEQKMLLPKVALLIYPVTDRRMLTESMKEFTDTPVWNSVLNKKMWDLYFLDGTKNIDCASPMEAASLIGFPQTYIEVAEFDCLRDEGIAFAEKLECVHTIGNKEISDIMEACRLRRSSTRR